MGPAVAAFLQRLKAFISRESLHGALERPHAGATVDASLLVSGWTFSQGRRIDRIEAVLGSHALGRVTYGLERPDVARVFPESAEARTCGFHARVALDAGMDGTLPLVVTATDDAGRTRTFRRTVRVAVARQPQAKSSRERIQQAARSSADPSFTAYALPSVSIVIPVHGQIAETEACLRQLQATLAADPPVEIIVVDDASPDDTAVTLARRRESDLRIVVVTNERNVGFGESCNRGARAARNDVVVFLNNDTLPQAGWLPPLVSPFRDPAVGAVGARLLYPDGSLQEAGGVVFADGSGWNFGRGSPDPDDPLFTFVREVDYCSGAALATRRSQFLELGGFDARFAPAYYEDTDYGFTLRSHGLKVLYQPACVIVHVEGATSGTDERHGVKRAQVANRSAFQQKWRHALVNQPAPSDASDRAALYRHVVREPNARRVLVCAPTLPEWDRESGSRRVFDLVTFLRECGWAVSFATDSIEGGERYVSALQQAGVAVYTGLPSELVACGRFDAALLHFWWIAERYIPVLRRSSPSTRIVVDSVDLHFLRRSRSPNGGPTDADEKRRELDAYAHADMVLTVSEPEAEIVAQLGVRPVTAGARRSSRAVQVVPDAESFAPSPLAFDDRQGLLFLGNFRHEPNRDALEYLLRAIVPLLPAALLERHAISVVGTDLTDALVARCGGRRPGVDFVGWVPSVQPCIERARVMLAPLTYGAGTKRKLIQSAMIGTPAVSTSVGVEGLPLRHDEHVLVADSADAFAASVVRLVDDRALWNRLADSGRDAIRIAHDREAVRRRFKTVMDGLLLP